MSCHVMSCHVMSCHVMSCLDINFLWSSFVSFFFHYSTHFLSCLLLFHFYSLHFTSLLFSSSLFFPLLLTSILLCSFRLFPSLRLLCPHLSFRQCYALSSSPLLFSPNFFDLSYMSNGIPSSSNWAYSSCTEEDAAPIFTSHSKEERI